MKVVHRLYTGINILLETKHAMNYVKYITIVKNTVGEAVIATLLTLPSNRIMKGDIPMNFGS